MRRHSPSATMIRRDRIWPSFLANVHLVMFGAAFGLIAAIVVAAPQLRLP